MKFREAAIVSGGLMAQQVTVFATGVLTARYLGAASFGVLGTLKSLSTFLLIATPLGLDLALLKHASFYHDRPAELRQLATALRLLVAGLNTAILVLVLLLVGPWLQQIYNEIPHFARLASITVLGLIFAADVQISGALYRVANRVTLYSLVVNYTQPALRLCISYAALRLGCGVIGITWVNTAMLAASFTMLALVRRGSRAAPRLRLPALLDQVRTILGESLWMAMLLLVYQAMRFVDVLMLAAMSTPKITGEYTAMSTVAQLIQIYPAALSQTLGPRIALLFKAGDMAGIVNALKDYLRKASLIGGFLFGGVAVFGTHLDLVFGSAFHFPWQLPVLLATGWYVSATLAPFGYVLSMTGRHRQELVILSIGAVLLIAGLRLLIPPLGSIGAALAVMMVFIIVNVIRSAYVFSVLKINPLSPSDVAPPVCFALVAQTCAVVGHAVAGKHIAASVAECVTYGLLAAICYLVLFATPVEKAQIGKRLLLRRHPG